MRWLEYDEKRYVNLDQVTDIIISRDGTGITFYFNFLNSEQDQAYVAAADKDFVPGILNALRNRVWPFSDSGS